MTGHLLRSIWFPADSQLTEVNPGAVFQLIAARGEPSALNIYENRRLVGNLAIQASSVGTGPNALTKLSLNGSLNLKSLLFPETRLDLNCQMDLDREGRLCSSQLTLGSAKPKLKLALAQTSPSAAAMVRLTQEDRVLLDSSFSDHEKPEDNPFITLLLGTLGVSVADFQAVRADAEVQAAETKMEARQGKFELGDTTRQGFVLKIGALGKPGFRICVENTGEIVRLETPVSYDLISESVRQVSVSLP